MAHRVGHGVASGRGGGRRDKYEEERIYEDIRRALADGLNDNAAALYADCSSRTVQRYRKRHGIPTNFPRRS